MNEAKNTVANLESALDRSAAAVSAAEEKLSQVVTSGTGFVQQRLAELKAGQGLTALASVKRVTRYQAEEEVELAKIAHATLESEAERARNALARADDARYWEAVRVAFSFAEPLVTELQALNERRRDLCRSLAGLANYQVRKNKPADITEPANLSAALQDLEPHMPGLLRDAMWQRWSKRIDVLVDNPDAELDDPPALRQEDAIFNRHPGGLSAGGWVTYKVL